MKAKNRWLSESCRKLKRIAKNRTDAEILWTSSSSSSEIEDSCDFSANTSRLSKNNGIADETNRSWIKIREHYCTPPPELVNIETPSTQVIISSESPESNKKTTEIVSKVQAQVEESPVIDRFLVLGENSPLLNQISPNSLSPIIGRSKKRARRKIRHPFENDEIEKKGYHSIINYDDEHSLSSSSQASKVIETSELSQTIITQISESCTIDPFPSQHSSEVVQIESPSAPNTEISNADNHSGGSSATRRKRFKKGGLASQLQRAVTNYRSKLAIRDHEMYRNRDVQLSQGAENVIQFKILEKWTEFGCLVCRCAQLSEDEDILIVVGFNLDISGLKLELGKNFYKVLPPYNVKMIKFRNEDIICYYNVSKILEDSIV